MVWIRFFASVAVTYVRHEFDVPNHGLWIPTFKTSLDAHAERLTQPFHWPAAALRRLPSSWIWSRRNSGTRLTTPRNWNPSGANLVDARRGNSRSIFLTMTRQWMLQIGGQDSLSVCWVTQRKATGNIFESGLTAIEFLAQGFALFVNHSFILLAFSKGRDIFLQPKWTWPKDMTSDPKEIPVRHYDRVAEELQNGFRAHARVLNWSKLVHALLILL